MHQLLSKWCESLPQHSDSHLKRIIIGAVIQYSIILTLGFVEVKKPSPMLASTINIPYSFSGQLQWKQLEFNSLHSVPPITSMCPLRMSVIWSGGALRCWVAGGCQPNPALSSAEPQVRPSALLSLRPLTGFAPPFFPTTGGEQEGEVEDLLLSPIKLWQDSSCGVKCLWKACADFLKKSGKIWWKLGLESKQCGI